MKRFYYFISIFLVAIALISCGSTEVDNGDVDGFVSYNDSSNSEIVSVSGSGSSPDSSMADSLEKTYKEVLPAENVEVVEDKSVEGKTALDSAKKMLFSYPYSEEGLIGALMYNGFSEKESIDAVKNCGTDWEYQAVRMGKSYMKISAVKEPSLREKLKRKGFTETQIDKACRELFPDQSYEIEKPKEKIVEKKTEPAKVADVKPANKPTVITTGMRNARKKAESYLQFKAFSRKGLIEQLVYSGFSEREAEYAVDACGASWDEQAVLSAKSYLAFMAFSKEGLIEQLEYEGYTSSQARYGAENAYRGSHSGSGVSVGKQNALKKADSYLGVMAFSRKGLIDQLKYDGFSDAEAQYAVDNCRADWNAQAVEKAKSYMRTFSFSRSELVDQLIYEGFTRSQAEHGASAAYSSR